MVARNKDAEDWFLHCRYFRALKGRLFDVLGSLVDPPKTPTLRATTVTDLAIAAYERALEPKKLAILEGGKHFDAYTEPGLSQSAPPAVEWFERHLMGHEETATGSRRTASTP